MKNIRVSLYIVGLWMVLAGCATAYEERQEADIELTDTAVTDAEGTDDMNEGEEVPEELEHSTDAVMGEGETREETESQKTVYDAPYTGEPIELERVFSDIAFDQPLYLTYAPGDDKAVYIVEKTGQVKRISYVEEAEDTTVTAETYLDLSDIVSTSGSEKGLLGLAFHPDYATNGEAYVNYTQGNKSVIARYTNGDAATGTQVLTFDQPYDNHNGGQLVFGPDGYLYIGTGDGGGAGDPAENAQNLKTFPGSILRIDVNNTEGDSAYAIPEDNPLVGNTEGFLEEIYAYGFRNPWRFSYDPYRNRFIVADVGQDAREEIDLLTGGGNYGWPRMEGTATYKPNAQVADETLINPVWEYEHPVGGSITGGYVVKGPEEEALTGLYIYGDFVSGLVWGLWWDAEDAPTHYLLAESGMNIASFGQGPSGDVYIIDFSGGIYKIGLE